jgi:protein glucosyltransferase
MKLFGMIVLCLMTSLGAINPPVFYEKLKAPAPHWMMEQISNDLALFHNELSQKFLDELFVKEGLLLVRVRVRNGIITIEQSPDAARHSVPNEIIPHILTLHSLKPLPDVDFLFTGHDGLPSYVKWPVFTISKDKKSQGLIVFPDWYSLRGFEPEKSLVLEGNQIYPWEHKKPMLFFRGGDSGIVDANNWKDSPRPRLVALSLQNPTLIDARFALSLHHRHMYDIALAEGYIGDYVSLRDHPAYKFLMDVDGNCAATPRFPLLMHSTSVIIKNMTPSILWFYRAVKPYKHFIPVKEGLSDLLYQIKWAKLNDGECHKISQQAQQLAAEILTQEMAYVYLYRLIEAYALKQQGLYQLD